MSLHQRVNKEPWHFSSLKKIQIACIDMAEVLHIRLCSKNLSVFVADLPSMSPSARRMSIFIQSRHAREMIYSTEEN